MQDCLGTYHHSLFKDVWTDVLFELAHPNNPFRHYFDTYVAVVLWMVFSRVYVDAMDDAVSSIDPAMPIATPADNYLLVRTILRESMEDMKKQQGDWSDRKPHADFVDPEHGLYREIVWTVKPVAPAAAPTAPVPPKDISIPGANLERNQKKRAVEKAKKDAAKKKQASAGPAGQPNPVVTTPPVPPVVTGPCLVYLAEQAGFLINKQPIKCGGRSGSCRNGFHATLKSMTRKQCVAEAKTSTWKYAAGVASDFAAANSSLFA